MHIFLWIMLGVLILALIGLVFSFQKNSFVHKQFWEKLEEICKQEKLNVIMHENLMTLNLEVYGEEWVENRDRGKLAIGVYQYAKNKESSFIPEIHLCKDGDVWTFAHEIGHHLSISRLEDESERTANLARGVLMRKFIPWWHKFLIPGELLVYGNMG